MCSLNRDTSSNKYDTNSNLKQCLLQAQGNSRPLHEQALIDLHPPPLPPSLPSSPHRRPGLLPTCMYMYMVDYLDYSSSPSVLLIGREVPLASRNTSDSQVTLNTTNPMLEAGNLGSMKLAREDTCSPSEYPHDVHQCSRLFDINEAYVASQSTTSPQKGLVCQNLSTSVFETSEPEAPSQHEETMIMNYMYMYMYVSTIIRVRAARAIATCIHCIHCIYICIYYYTYPTLFSAASNRPD